MYILAGDHKVTITKHTVNRYDNKRGLVLTLTTTKDNISLADLDAICDDIRVNKLDILVYDETDELVATLRGFWHNCLVSKDSVDGSLKAEITNESENTYQIGVLQNRSTNLEKNSVAQRTQLVGLDNTVAMQDEALIELYEMLGGN